MTNYDTEIRRIAEEIRHILDNCTDAPRLLREYAGLYTQTEMEKEMEEATNKLEETIDGLEETIDDLRTELCEALKGD